MKVLFRPYGRHFALLSLTILLAITLTGCGKKGDPKAVQCDVPDKSSYVYPPHNASA